MSSASDFSVGLAHQFIVTAAKVGFEPKDIAGLAHSEGRCKQVLEYLRGHSELKPIDTIIDLDDNPFVPEGWTLVSHRKDGRWKIDIPNVRRYLSEEQIRGESVRASKLKKELADIPVLNANVLDYLLANQFLIPESWKGIYTFFWGTTYKTSEGVLAVRYLREEGKDWRWDWAGAEALLPHHCVAVLYR